MRNQLFLSHANPEENVFAAWLASRLRLAGYSVWVDVDSLPKGADFWQTIDGEIRERSCRFLFVVTKTSLSKPGTLQELAVAKAVQKKLSEPHFIIPLCLDDTSPSDFPPDLIRINAITEFFSEDWGVGLGVLLEALSKIQVPNFPNVFKSDPIGDWFKATGVRQHQANASVERYISNWHRINLPTGLQVHEFSGDKSLLPRGVVAKDNFALAAALLPKTIQWEKAHWITIENFTTNNSVKIAGKLLARPKDVLIEFITKSLSDFLIKKGAHVYPLSNGREAFYFRNWSRIKINIPGKTWRSIAGKFKGSEWHFAVSFDPFLYPFPGVSVLTHVVFTRDGKVLPAKAQHSRRRALGSDWYNNKWRDVSLAFFAQLRDIESTQITITDGSQPLVLESIPLEFQSQHGYVEPTRDVESEEQQVVAGEDVDEE